MEDIRKKISQGRFLFDGGMGTYFSSLHHTTAGGVERANIDKPILIRAIHEEYLRAGCQAIKTNTFAANRVMYEGDGDLVRRMISAGWKIASEEAGRHGAYVFADIGPVTGLEPDRTAEEYIFVADTFLDLGAENFLFETNENMAGLIEAARHIKSRRPDAYIIVSFALLPEGYTRDGVFGEDLFHEAAGAGCFDAAGFNCVIGVRQMEELLAGIDTGGFTLSVMPNAGYPVVIDNRTYYDSDPEFFGEGLARLAASGASIVGGCCGTTPKHLAAARKALGVDIDAGTAAPVQRGRFEAAESDFYRKLMDGEKVIAVELDPPKDSDVRGFMEGAERIRESGADIITIADCPIARARMDSSMLACIMKRDVGIEALPHLTCRDRNLNATKALLLGLSAEGIRNVLVVTGDPIPTAERDEVKTVYQFNSRKMASFITNLGKKGQTAEFGIFGALNVNALNFDVQLGLAQEKVRNGMCGLLTQPVLSEEAVGNVARAHEVLRKGMGCRLLGGIMPVVSERNARFMNSEINGMHVDDEIVERYAGLGREEAEDEAVKISRYFARKIAPYVDGFYIMTPFNRVGLVCRVIDAVREVQEECE